MPQPQEVKASLGCGTLILIALIVAMFSGQNDHSDIENQLESLTLEVQRLRSDIHSLRNNAQDLTMVEGQVERILTAREARHVKKLRPKVESMLADMIPSDGPPFAKEPTTYEDLFAPLVEIVGAMVEE